MQHLPAELLLLVAERVVCLEDEQGIQLAEEVFASLSSFAAMCASCTAVRDALVGTAIKDEMRCRRSSLAPPQTWSSSPFKDQVAREERAKQLVRVLDKMVTSVAGHCAASHCTQARRMLNRSNADTQLAIAHTNARRMALGRQRAFLFCTSDEKNDSSKWIVAAELRGFPVWSSKTDLVLTHRLPLTEHVETMVCDDDLLLFGTSDAVWGWKPGSASWQLRSTVPGMVIVDKFVSKGHPRLVLCSYAVDTSLFSLQNGGEYEDLRCVVAHLREGQVTRYTSETEGVHCNLRAARAGSVALTVTVGGRERARVQFLDMQSDEQELVTGEMPRAQIVATALSPRGDTAVVFSLAMKAQARVFLRLRAMSWTQLSVVEVPALMSSWGAMWSLPDRIPTQAVFTACGSKVLFSGPLITPRPAIGSLEVGGVINRRTAREPRVRMSTVEGLPRQILCGEGGILLRTHRGAVLLRARV